MGRYAVLNNHANVEADFFCGPWSVVVKYGDFDHLEPLGREMLHFCTEAGEHMSRADRIPHYFPRRF